MCRRSRTSRSRTALWRPRTMSSSLNASNCRRCYWRGSGSGGLRMGSRWWSRWRRCG
uniref:Uncharacterized protein n=1 Tax=Arundo donax TaxID=35708 RepID=A0A0A8YTP3_ARUDO